MSTLTVRDVPDEVKTKLRVRAAKHGRSMEAEVRSILAETVLRSPESEDLVELMRAPFEDIGGVELELPSRRSVPRAAEFKE